MQEYNINNINNIDKYINSIVRVCYKKEESDTPDNTGAILLGITDDGFDTSAGVFEKIWLWDSPVPLFVREDSDNEHAITWSTLIDSRCVCLLPVNWFTLPCAFTNKVCNNDPILNGDISLSFIEDIDIEGSMFDNDKVFCTMDNIMYAYAILL